MKNCVKRKKIGITGMEDNTQKSEVQFDRYADRSDGTPTLIMGVPIKEVYTDQGPINTHFKGYSFGCWYSPHGIQQLESDYCRRIQGTNRYGDPIDMNPTDIAQHIAEEPHLHRIIKDNLILNLKNYNEGFEEQIDKIVADIYAEQERQKTIYDSEQAKRESTLNLVEAVTVSGSDLDESKEIQAILDEAAKKIQEINNKDY